MKKKPIKKVRKTFKKRSHKVLYILAGILFLMIVATFLRSYTKHGSNQVLFPDPDNYYSLRIPSSWTMKVAYGTEKTHLGTPEEKTTPIEIATLYGKDRTGITVQVYEGPHDCDTVKQTNATFNGFPAVYDEFARTYVLYASDATYIIGYTYPGLTNFRSSPFRKVSPTPVSESSIEQNKNIIAKSLESFSLRGAKPLECK